MNLSVVLSYCGLCANKELIFWNDLQRYQARQLAAR